MTVDEIKRIVVSVVSAEKTGYALTAEQFNLYLQKANTDLFNQAVRALGVVQKVTDILMPFKVRTGLTFLSGAAALPSDYARFLTIYDPINEVPIEILDDSEIGDRLNNPITAPTTTYPVVFFVNNQVNILPTTIETITGTADAGGSGTALVRKTGTSFLTSGVKVRNLIRNTTDGSWAEIVTITDGDNIVTTALQGGTANTWAENDAYSVGIEMHYVKKPTTPVYAEEVDNGINIYDSSNSTQLEWDSLQHPDIIRLIITQTGVDVKDSLIVQAINQEKQENIK